MANKDVNELNNQLQSDDSAASASSSANYTYHRPAHVIDDFVTPAHQSPPRPAASEPSHDHDHQPQRQLAQYHHHNPERSQTLMRSVVSPPTHQPLSFRRVRTPAGSLPPRPTMTLSIDNIRQTERGAAVNVDNFPRSAKIKRFNPETEFVPVAAPKPELPPAVKVQPEPEPAVVADTVSSHPVVNDGYHRANSHQEKFDPKIHHDKKNKSGRRWLKPLLTTFIVALVLAGLATGGWFVYQKSPVVDARFASYRAHFTIEVPAYAPSGFSFKTPIYYVRHQAALTYRAAGSGQYYKVWERVSSWNSQALLTNVVTNDNQTYQTYQAGGLYIYVYGDNNATWVSHGVWYQITGNENISAKKLAEIAAST